MTVGADEFRTCFGQWIDRIAAGEAAVVTRRGKPIVRLTPIAPASTTVPAAAVASPPNSPADVLAATSPAIPPAPAPPTVAPPSAPRAVAPMLHTADCS